MYLLDDFLFGSETRPEVIRISPFVKELQSREGIKSIVCVTGQHKTMLKQVLSAFHVEPDYELSIYERETNAV